jgi:integrase
MLIGCGLRRGELLGLQVESIKLREEHWVIADLLGKAGHIRTVPVPVWVTESIDAWKQASSITEARSFDRSTKPVGSGEAA